MKLIFAFIKKCLGIASPSVSILGYKYEWDYLIHKRKEK